MTLWPPSEVLAAYGLERARIEPITLGLINLTYRVTLGDRRLVLQRLHPVFAPEVNLDIDAITSHLEARGVSTPRLVRTRNERLWVEAVDGVWRVMTLVEGRCLTEIRTPSLARAAGAMAGRFTRATADLHHNFAFGRSGVHDTDAHLERLARARREHGARLPEVSRLADEIAEDAASLPPRPTLPSRIVHGDLKASNILFALDRDEALCLVDLDTLAYGTVLTEMGDALRSWTNPKGEDDSRGEVDLALFAAAVEGYLNEVGAMLTSDERASFAIGLETIALELAARFCIDAFEDRYFGWNPQRYPSRCAHNLVRARAQLSLARSARRRRADLERLADVAARRVGLQR